ncbi:MAG: hypothetical protein NXI13_13245 [Proteobacteria bacterium]|nr:hypothetical protein [Pseudomonadota bacterium]
MKLARPIYFFGTLAGLMAISTPAYAYLDPGTGSMLLQLLLGGVAGLLVVGKLYFQKITGIFRRDAVAENGSMDMPGEDTEK